MSKKIELKVKANGKVGRPCIEEQKVERPGSMLDYYDKSNLITGWVASYKNGVYYNNSKAVRETQTLIAKASGVTRNV